jgi:hypothetical protein
MPVEVGIALPEDSVSCVMLSVPCGMKQDSAERSPEFRAAESVISLYRNNTESLLGVLTLGSLQIGVRAWPPVEMPSACENARCAADRIHQDVAVARPTGRCAARKRWPATAGALMHVSFRSPGSGLIFDSTL